MPYMAPQQHHGVGASGTGRLVQHCGDNAGSRHPTVLTPPTLFAWAYVGMVVVESLTAAMRGSQQHHGVGDGGAGYFITHCGDNAGQPIPWDGVDVTPRILREFARILRTSPALFTPALFSLPHFLPPPALTESS